MADETGSPPEGSGGVADEIKQGLLSIPGTIKQVITDPADCLFHLP